MCQEFGKSKHYHLNHSPNMKNDVSNVISLVLSFFQMESRLFVYALLTMPMDSRLCTDTLSTMSVDSRLYFVLLTILLVLSTMIFFSVDYVQAKYLKKPLLFSSVDYVEVIVDYHSVGKVSQPVNYHIAFVDYVSVLFSNIVN